jgi:hypothetical protein
MDACRVLSPSARLASTPAGLVPSRRHPWGSTLQRIVRFLSRSPFGKPCPSFPWPGSLVSRATQVRLFAQVRLGCFLADAAVASSPWVGAHVRAFPCGNTSRWQLRGLLAWPAPLQSEDRKDVGGLACAFSVLACAGWKAVLAFASWNSGVGAQGARVVSGRHSTACRNSHLSWVSRPSGFDDVDRALDFASSLPSRSWPYRAGRTGASGYQRIRIATGLS